MYWTRRRAFLSFLAAFILGGIAVWAKEKWQGRPDSSPSAMATLDAFAEGTLPVPEPILVAEQSTVGHVSDPAFLSTIRNSLLPVPTAGEAPTTTDRGAGAPLNQAESVPLPPLPAPDPAAPPPLGSSSVAPPQPAQPDPAAPIASPWAVLVEQGEGRNHLTVLRDKEVRIRLSCTRLDLQSPKGCLRAQGAVQVSAAGLVGTCQQLTLSWEHDKVLLEGNVHLKCPKDGQDVELTADRLSVRLNTLTPAAAAEAVEILLFAPKPKVGE